MIFTFDYDTAYAGPAFPTVQVTVRSLDESSPEFEQRAYVDSGADGTIIPLSILQQINARKVDEMNLRWGSSPGYRVDIYEVLLQFGSFRAMKAYVAADSHEADILLGRDVLNHYIVTLNGLASAVEVSQ